VPLCIQHDLSTFFARCESRTVRVQKEGSPSTAITALLSVQKNDT
jgi:hypothetical protein